jgi:hypothetical protein
MRSALNTYYHFSIHGRARGFIYLAPIISYQAKKPSLQKGKDRRNQWVSVVCALLTGSFLSSRDTCKI